MSTAVVRSQSTGCRSERAFSRPSLAAITRKVAEFTTYQIMAHLAETTHVLRRRRIGHRHHPSTGKRGCTFCAGPVGVN